jgi:hypothetical protein
MGCYPLDEIHEDWREGRDPERAVRQAQDALETMTVDTELSFEERLEIVRVTMGPLVDGPGCDPLRAARLVTLVARIWRAIELNEPTTPEQRMSTRVELSVHHCRGAHCGLESRPALGHALAAITQVENFAGGRERMLLALAETSPNATAAAAIAIVGILAASLKRTFRDPHHPTRLYWLGQIRAMIDSYLPDRRVELAVRYPYDDALVQAFYLLVEQGDPIDERRIDALLAFDRLARPDDHRARLTIPMRDVAAAVARGDVPKAAAKSALAIRTFETNGLWRHLRVAEAEGYFVGVRG